MNVLLVILHADPARGGAERYTRDLAAQLLSRGVHVTTAAATFAPDWPGTHLPLTHTGLTRSARYTSFLNSLDHHLTRQPHDIVHAMLPVRRAHLYHPHAGIAAMPKRTGLLEHLNRRRRSMHNVEAALLSPASPAPTVTLCLSQYSQTQFRQHYPTAPAVVVLNGVDTRFFDPAPFTATRPATRAAWGVNENELALLCVAQDFQRKGVDLAIRALAELPDLPARLVVVGKDDPRQMRSLATQLGVQAKVLFTGPLSDPRPAYAAGDLFVFPTRHDPCPLVTLEALAMGLPVISTRFNGACEYMTQDLHGHVLTALPQLATAIRQFAPQEVRERARQACLALREELSIEHHVQRVLSVYEEVQAYAPPMVHRNDPHTSARSP